MLSGLLYWVKLRSTQCEHMFSRLPLKADFAQYSRHVSKVRLPEVGGAVLRLIDNKNSVGNSRGKSPGRVPWKDSVNKICGATITPAQIDTIADQSAGYDMLSISVKRRQPHVRSPRLRRHPCREG